MIFAICGNFIATLPQQAVKLEGVVTYLSSQNVYVEFASTSGIREDDTLFYLDNQILKAGIRVKFISSRSVAGERIGDYQPVKGNKLIAFVVTQKTEKIQSDTLNADTSRHILKTEAANLSPVISAVNKKYGRGRLSIQSSSDISLNNQNDRNQQRWRYTFTYNSDNVLNSGVSFEAYTNYSYSTNGFIKANNSFFRNLKVFSLNAGFSPAEKSELKIGRFQNRFLSSLGPVDGVLASYDFSSVTAGAVLGSRPDFSNYGYNLKLKQFGAYAAREDSLKAVYTENSAGIFQQMNGGGIDRRFFYYQNSTLLFSNASFFFSSEFDFYKREAGIIKNQVSLTGLFSSVRYSPARFISLGVSYDARRNIIYFETYRNSLDSIIINELRKGWRLNATIKPISGLTIGVSNSYRSRQGGRKGANTLSAYLNYYRLPLIEVSPTVSYTNISNSFISGHTAGLSLSANVLSLFDITAGYKYLSYQYLSAAGSLKQHTVNADIYYSIIQDLYLGLNYEYSSDTNFKTNRLFIDLTQRF